MRAGSCAWAVLGAVCVIGAAMTLQGCLRNQFDLCAGSAPHPDCARLDAGPPDGGADANTEAGDGG
jgi:hypothetical protein